MPTELAVTTPDWSSKIDLVKRTVAAGTSDDEFQLFLYQAKKSGLDPLAKQIYAVMRWNKKAGREVMTVQTGIDGYRLIADRTGRLAGISDPSFTYAKEGDKVPLSASVTVKKVIGDSGLIGEFTATARWSEYVVDGPGGMMWTSKPHIMLGKCAEALALRKAFPADLSGVYTSEEMQQADSAEQGAAVYAEVARQKASHTAVSYPTLGDGEAVVEEAPKGRNAITGAPIPPELDWSYNAKTGILICRPIDVEKRTTKGNPAKEFIAMKINGKADGKDMLFCWHTAHAPALLSCMGKVVKLEVQLSKDGKFLNIENVLEVDGQKYEGASEPSAEFQAQLIASELEMDADELNELVNHINKGDWAQTLDMLKTRKADIAAEAF